MRATFSLGRTAGIWVGVHWSVLVAFVLILAGRAGGSSRKLIRIARHGSTGLPRW
ncbi:hypothetical protein ABZ092_16300 [Streptomyces bobili]|uniref:hypothetical protein n=1 Tax=Streptomyces bobili TaxID=67280 RepID=UPI0033BB17E2